MPVICGLRFIRDMRATHGVHVMCVMRVMRVQCGIRHISAMGVFGGVMCMT